MKIATIIIKDSETVYLMGTLENIDKIKDVISTAVESLDILIKRAEYSEN